MIKNKAIILDLMVIRSSSPKPSMIYGAGGKPARSKITEELKKN
jgi:hypothetical protein